MYHVGPVVADVSSVTENSPPVANAPLHSNPAWDTAKTNLYDGQTAWQAEGN